MRSTITLLTVALATYTFHPTQAQWGTDVQNNGINYEFGIQDNAYSGDNDWDSQADPTIRTDVWLSTYGWIGEWCHTMEMDLGHLPDGSYMLRMNDPQWDAVKRIIIQH